MRSSNWSRFVRRVPPAIAHQRLHVDWLRPHRRTALVATRKREQRGHDLFQLDGDHPRVSKKLPRALHIVRPALADLAGGAQLGDRRAQLVREVAGKPLLFLERLLHAIEQAVDGRLNRGQLHRRRGHMEPGRQRAWGDGRDLRIDLLDRPQPARDGPAHEPRQSARERHRDRATREVERGEQSVEMHAAARHHEHQLHAVLVHRRGNGEGSVPEDLQPRRAALNCRPRGGKFFAAAVRGGHWEAPRSRRHQRGPRGAADCPCPASATDPRRCRPRGIAGNRRGPDFRANPPSK